MPPVGVSKKTTRRLRSAPSGVKQRLKSKSKVKNNRKNNRTNLLAKRNKLTPAKVLDNVPSRADVELTFVKATETESDTEVGAFEPSKSCEIFQIDSTTAVVGLHCPQKIKIHGCAKITALQGSFEIQGCKFNPGEEHEVFAPLTHPACVINVLQNNTIHGNTKQFHRDIASKLQEWSKVYSVIVVFTSVSVYPLPGYPDVYSIKPGDVDESQELCQGCWVCETNRHFIEKNGYSEIAEEICLYNLMSNSSNAYPVVITTGGKNVGKSTFNQFLINKLLQKNAHVYYLECDIGQTEFTPSGLLSITKITANHPLLGPPFTHQTKPLYTCFYGNNTPAGDPDRYVHCIEFLLHHLSENLSDSLDGPLVVNTMGWIRALGLQLLVDTIRIAHPTHVVQFTTNKESRNAVTLSPEYLKHASGWITSSSKKSNCHEYKHMTMAVEYFVPEVIKYMAPDMRNLAMFSYLSNMADACRTNSQSHKSMPLLARLLELQPRSVSTENILVCNASGHPVKKQLSFALLNASIVGLCIVDDNDVAAYKDDENDCLPNAPVCSCVGLGLVGGVSPNDGEIIVLSSLSTDSLQNVNCIICGSLNIPEPLLLEQKSTASSIAPYVTRNFPYTTVGAGMFRVHRKFSKLPSSAK